MNTIQKNKVYLFSEPNFIGISLLENLLSKNFLVSVFAKDKKGWQQLTKHLETKFNFTFNNSFRNLSFENIDYALYVDGFDTRVNNEYPFAEKVKTIVIVPFEKYEWFQNRKYLSSSSIVVYAGDVIGPRINLNSGTFISKSISEMVNKKTLTVGVGELFYPIFISDFVKVVAGYMFSFGPYGNEVLLLGNQTSSMVLWSEAEKLIPELKIKYDTEIKTRSIPVISHKQYVDSDIQFSLEETINWLRVKKEAKPKILKKHKSHKYINRIYLAILILLLMPFVFFTIGSLVYLSAYKNFSNDKIIMAKPFWIASLESARFFSTIPALGMVYREAEFASSAALQIGNLAIHLQPVVKFSNELFNKVLGNEIYDVNIVSSELNNSLQPLYLDLSGLNLLAQNERYSNTYLKKYLDKKVDLEKLTSLSNNLSEVTRYIPDILGASKNKTYLILFQNNLELRPTGGFIGSYGLVTFEKGRLNDMIVSDVYSLDAQLKGHIEPPEVLKKNLELTSWYLRDSNWNPDFLVSAERAEWFLDKEIGKSVDGVIAINLNPIRELLAFTGPIFLSDTNEEISTTNFYDKAQEEVDNSFYPESSKKTSFLTPLSRRLLTDFGKTDTRRRFEMLKILHKNFESKDVQVALHNERVQKFFSKLKWDGAVLNNTCPDGCYPDTVGIVEANIGRNRANLFIKRNISMEVNTDGNTLLRHLKIDLINTASESLGPPGKYKAYIRLLTPKKITHLEVDALEIVEQKDTIEAGQLIEILPGETKRIEYLWESEKTVNFNPEDYNLYFRKQSGVEAYPFTLTVDGVKRYNELVTKDLFLDNQNGH